MRALIIGMGGIGCPAALALARRGVPLRLVDEDRVDLSNLHRQVLFQTRDVGRPKVEAAKERLQELYDTDIETHSARFTPASARRLVQGIGVMVDGSDNFETRFFANDMAVAEQIPLVHAAALQFTCQWLTVLPGSGPCYRCLFEEAPPRGSVPTCARSGVLGPVAGLAGALAAQETHRIMRDEASLFAGRLVSFDARKDQFREVSFNPRPHCQTCMGHNHERRAV